MTMASEFLHLDLDWTVSPACAVALAVGVLKDEEISEAESTQWYRSLAGAVLAYVGLESSAPCRGMTEGKRGTALRRALGMVTRTNPRNALGRAWRLRDAIALPPSLAEGVFEGSPFNLLDRESDLEDIAYEADRAIYEHSLKAREVLRPLDKVILGLWGCDRKRIDEPVPLRALEKRGLKLLTHGPYDPYAAYGLNEDD